MPSAWIATKSNPQLVEAFQVAGWEVGVTAPADLAPASRRVDKPDVLIFETLEGPVLDEVLELFRVRYAPMLIITANWAFARQARDAGADEVMVAPVNPIELLFRAERLVRAAKVVRVGELAIDLPAQTVERGGRVIQLSPAGFRLLACLTRHIGQAVSYDEILQEAFGYFPELGGTQEQVKSCVKRVRKKIEPDPRHPQYIIAVRGVGYCLKNQTQWEEDEASALGRPK